MSLNTVPCQIIPTHSNQTSWVAPLFFDIIFETFEGNDHCLSVAVKETVSFLVYCIYKIRPCTSTIWVGVGYRPRNQPHAEQTARKSDSPLLTMTSLGSTIKCIITVRYYFCFDWTVIYFTDDVYSCDVPTVFCNLRSYRGRWGRATSGSSCT